MDATQSTTITSQQVGETPMAKRIATIPSLKGNFDFKITREAGVTNINSVGNTINNHGNKQRIIIVGTTFDYTRSPGDNGPHTCLVSLAPHASWEVEDTRENETVSPPDDEDGYTGDGIIGRANYYK